VHTERAASVLGAADDAPKDGVTPMASKPKKPPADEADAEPGEGAAKGSKKSGGGLFSRMNIIIAAAAVVVIGGGSAGYFMMRGPKQAAPAQVQVKPAIFLDVPEVLVNLSSTGGERTQYLKVKVVLELPDATVQPQIQTTMPRVMDAFQTYLRELRPSDLDGSAGLYRLKEELTRRVNAAIAPSRINAVLFKEIVVQ
jgi:flagellar FliL protein